MTTHQSGMIALVTVLVVGAIVLVVGVGIATRSMIEGNMSADTEQSNEALSLATSCMETALFTLSNNAAYAGNETVSIGSQSCIIQPVANLGGNLRTVKTSATVNGHTRRLQVDVSNVNPPLHISAWQEISS